MVVVKKVCCAVLLGIMIPNEHKRTTNKFSYIF